MPFIMITVLLDMMAIGLIVPVLPHIVGTFTDSKEAQAWWFGAVALSFGLANFFGCAGARRPVGPLRPPAGAADRHRRPGA